MPIETKKYKADDLEAFCRDFEQSIDSADNGYIFIMTTEKIDFCKASKEVYESNAEKEKLFRQGMEIRVFNEKSEWKWFRTVCPGLPEYGCQGVSWSARFLP